MSESALAVLTEPLHQAGLEPLLYQIRALGQQEFEIKIALVERALPLAQSQPDILAELHYHLGRSYYFLSDYDQAMQHLQTAVQHYQFLGDSSYYAGALLSLGAMSQELGDMKEASDFLEQSLTMYRRLQEVKGEIRVLRSLGSLQWRLGDFAKALEFYQEAFKRNAEQSDASAGDTARLYASVAIALTSLGKQENKRHLLEQALEYSSRALALHQNLDLPWDLLNILEGRLELLIILHDFAGARDLFSETLELARSLGDQRGEAQCLGLMGDLYTAMNEPAQAVNYYEQTLSFYELLQVKDYAMFEVHHKLSGVFEHLGDYQKALAHFRTFHDLEGVYKNETALKKANRLSAKFELEKAQLSAEVQRLRSEELEVVVAQRTQQLESAHFDMLERLAVVAEFRDDNMGGHTQRVSDLAVRMAQRLGMDEEKIAQLRLASRLHDIGKISIPDHILLKPGKLSRQEWDYMKTHATTGAQMLSGGDGILELAREIALTHHERWDGSGYPQGLRGEAIPLSGRILAIADVYDALIHERPYKAAWSGEKAVQEIVEQGGKHFDPEVVKVFLEVMEEKGER